MRRAVTRTIKSAFLNTGAEAALRHFFPSRHPVIVRYHSVSRANDLISDGITVSPEVFEDQVRYFAKHFRPISMDALIDCVERRMPCPQNAIVLTFDDGYADNYQAAQTLKTYGLTGVFYITAGCIESDERFWVAEIQHLLRRTCAEEVHLHVGDKLFEARLSATTRTEAIKRLTHLIKTVDLKARERAREDLRRQLEDVPQLDMGLMLNWKQLAEMVAMGMELGGHTMTHCNLPSATQEEAWEEISQCKPRLEKMLDINVKHFAYPNGGSSQYYNGRIKEMVRQAGFRSAVTSRPGAVFPSSDPFELRRMRTTERLSDIVWELEESRIRPTSF